MKKLSEKKVWLRAINLGVVHYLCAIWALMSIEWQVASYLLGIREELLSTRYIIGCIIYLTYYCFLRFYAEIYCRRRDNRKKYKSIR